MPKYRAKFYWLESFWLDSPGRFPDESSGMGSRFVLLGVCLAVGLLAPPSTSSASQEWVMPKIPYPQAARLKHEQGTVILTVTTDPTGRVAKVVVAVPASQSDLPNISKKCVQWILAHWSGPPNRKLKTVEQFVLR